MLTIMLSILCVMNITPILQEAFKYIYIVLLFNKYINSFFIYLHMYDHDQTICLYKECMF